MAEERSSTGNLDLNFHPDPAESGPDPARMIELSQLFTTSANGATLPAGWANIAGAGRVSEVLEKCENGSKLMKKDNVTEEKKDSEKNVCNADSFFDCSICFDLSKDPVLTKCGHLYCWACLYLWLRYSWAKECPMCKADASVATLTPLFGRGKHRRDSEVSDPDIPPRPPARCTRFKTPLSTPTDMISQFEREFSSTGERRNVPLLNSFMTSRGLRADQNLSSEALVTPTSFYLTSNIFPENEGASRIPTEMISQFEREFSSTGERRDRPLLNSFMTSRGLRADQNLFSEALVTPTSFYLTSNIFPENEGASRIPRSFMAERFMDPYRIRHGFGRNQVQNSTPTVGVAGRHGFGRNQVQNSTPAVGVAGNDSEASTFGVINLESEVDNDEIESMLAVPASPPVGIHENGSRVPDVNSEDSRPLVRRRLT